MEIIFHVCDWSRPSNGDSRVMSLCVQLLDGLEITLNKIGGRLLSFTKEVGIEAVSWLVESKQHPGTSDLISERKPGN